MPLPVEFFRTARLRFRPFEADDVDSLTEICSNPETMRFIGDGRVLTREMAELWIKRSRENVERYGYGTGAVLELGSERMIGWAGVARPEGGLEEIVYGLRREEWGTGLGRELAEGLVNYLLESWELPELRATLYRENRTSRRILESLGFVQRPRSAAEDVDSCLYVLERRPGT